MARPFPGNDVPLIDISTGLMTQIWFEYFQNHQKLVQLPDVSAPAPTDGQSLKYVAATQKWTPG